MSKKPGKNRKTMCEILAAWREESNEWVLINPGFHSDIVERAINNKLLSSLKEYLVERREINYKSSRIDFLLRSSNSNKTALLEVKGCTLFEGHYCYYPDAPTKRGARHVKELMNAVKEGLNAYILFVVPGETRFVKPNKMIDPVFSRNLREAVNLGVKALAMRTKLEEGVIYFVKELPVIID